MKKIALALSATALFALAACDQETADTTDDTVTTAEETVVEQPNDTMMVDSEPTDGDNVSISEDGVAADINDGDTSINADISDGPSLEVETD